MTLATVDN